jgi:hypothetical protein
MKLPLRCPVAVTRLLLAPSELRALLSRRDELLQADERLAMQAALDEASPVLRAKLKRLLGPTPGRRPSRRQVASLHQVTRLIYGAKAGRSGRW